MDGQSLLETFRDEIMTISNKEFGHLQEKISKIEVSVGQINERTQHMTKDIGDIKTSLSEHLRADREEKMQLRKDISVNTETIGRVNVAVAGHGRLWGWLVLFLLAVTAAAIGCVLGKF